MSVGISLADRSFLFHKPSFHKDGLVAGKNKNLCNSSVMVRCLHACHPDPNKERAHVDHYQVGVTGGCIVCVGLGGNDDSELEQQHGQRYRQ
ncbi:MULTISPECIES: hypothetical protein [Pseudomonas syringae group]|uniref:hypothetical protein n=1 Tax=Pseudomonas syringae group TaxID=136849 RepID=UPI00137B7185|nr:MULTISPECIES: hypothetical protein [Pseudomonas syringae group]